VPARPRRRHGPPGAADDYGLLIDDCLDFAEGRGPLCILGAGGVEGVGPDLVEGRLTADSPGSVHRPWRSGIRALRQSPLISIMLESELFGFC
jgi:hypothetical protein